MDCGAPAYPSVSRRSKVDALRLSPYLWYFFHNAIFFGSGAMPPGRSKRRNALEKQRAAQRRTTTQNTPSMSAPIVWGVRQLFCPDEMRLGWRGAKRELDLRSC
ncbi:hypothetical protein Pla52o_48600 [Novipirellula galeiformis]|uniref:Uncharacterized protein n=1 Tax=Novipirellula galeiformis TaxID=2528004 RepID=A0A5C6C0C2_9BACT|nr:hypothetical protein Pla52o_48600 [Novipirellula galeiformis]